MAYEAAFDVVTLIYCDYAVLSKSDRLALLDKVVRALKPGGVFIVDVFTPGRRLPERQGWTVQEYGGFFCPEPHVLLESVHPFDDDDRTELNQWVVVTDDAVECFRVWDHFFTAEELVAEVAAAGFREWSVFDDVAGSAFSGSGETVCGVFWT